MSQQVQRGYEVAPLDKLPQRTPAEGILSYFEAGLLSQQTQVHQDLTERKVNINEPSYALLHSRKRARLKVLMWKYIVLCKSLQIIL